MTSTMILGTDMLQFLIVGLEIVLQRQLWRLRTLLVYLELVTFEAEQ
jgi:hypothetical protein